MDYKKAVRLKGGTKWYPGISRQGFFYVLIDGKETIPSSKRIAEVHDISKHPELMNKSTGGLLYGATDIAGRSGILAQHPDGTPLKLGGGEIIMSEKAATENCEKLSQMNQEAGGVAFDCDLQKVANTDRANGKMPKDEYFTESASVGTAEKGGVINSYSIVLIYTHKGLEVKQYPSSISYEQIYNEYKDSGIDILMTKIIPHISSGCENKVDDFRQWAFGEIGKYLGVSVDQEGVFEFEGNKYTINSCISYNNKKDFVIKSVGFVIEDNKGKEIDEVDFDVTSFYFDFHALKRNLGLPYNFKILNPTIYELKNVISGKSEVRYGDTIQSLISYIRANKRTSAFSAGEKFGKDKEEEILLKNDLPIPAPHQSFYITEGTEQRVYLDSKGKNVYKFNSGYFYNSWEEYLISLLIHNYLFRDTAYQLVGFSIIDGKLYSVVRQALVGITDEPTDLSEVEKFMNDNGFKKTERENYLNNEIGIAIEDLHQQNVITYKGRLFFVDTIIKIKNPDIFYHGGKIPKVDDIVSFYGTPSKIISIFAESDGKERAKIEIPYEGGTTPGLNLAKDWDYDIVDLSELEPIKKADAGTMIPERNQYEEAMRYIDNAKEQLQKAKLTADGNYYLDEKYVKSAGGIAYAGVEQALKWFIKLNGIEIEGRDADAIKMGLAKINKSLVKLFNTVYLQLHKDVYYGGETKKNIVDDAIEVAKQLISQLKPYNQPAVYAGGAKINPMETKLKESQSTSVLSEVIDRAYAEWRRGGSQPPDFMEWLQKNPIGESYLFQIAKAKTSAEKGAKIPPSETQFYYLKINNIVKDRQGNLSKIIRHTNDGIVVKSHQDIPYDIPEVEVTFDHFCKIIDNGFATIEGCPYSKDDVSQNYLLRHEIAMIKLLCDIECKDGKIAHHGAQVASHEAQVESLRKSYGDTIEGMEALAGGGRISNVIPFSNSLQLAHDVLLEVRKKMSESFSPTELKMIKENELLRVNSYSNGREQGYHLVFWGKGQGQGKAVSFSENRNSDSLVLYFGDNSSFNMQGNVPNEEIYRMAKNIPYENRIENGAKLIVDFIKSSITENDLKSYAKGVRIEKQPINKIVGDVIKDLKNGSEYTFSEAETGLNYTLSYDSRKKKFIEFEHADNEKREMDEYDARQLIYREETAWFEKGSRIENQYEKKYPVKVWEEWNTEQREHFLKDHKKDIGGVFYEERFRFINDKWIDIPRKVKDVIVQHVQEGQYADGATNKGGIIKKLTKEKNFWHARLRSPKGAVKCAVPEWGQTLAEIIQVGAKLTVCKFGEEWHVQKVMIPAKGVTKSEAKAIAEKVANKIQNPKLSEKEIQKRHEAMLSVHEQQYDARRKEKAKLRTPEGNK